jgi:acyl-coenzyme A thioesterase PaaI-like protein
MGTPTPTDNGGFGILIPFVAMLGLQLQRFENGESDLFLPYKAEHDNSFAVIHGGTLMTVLDVAMASAARAGGGVGESTREALLSPRSSSHSQASHSRPHGGPHRCSVRQDGTYAAALARPWLVASAGCVHP